MQWKNKETVAPSNVAAGAKKTNVRWMVVAVLFFVTLINYADRSSISLAGPGMAKELGLSVVDMGFIFSAFGWAYVIFQLPGGWLLDRFGSKMIQPEHFSLVVIYVNDRVGGLCHRRNGGDGDFYSALSGGGGGVAVVSGE